MKQLYLLTFVLILSISMQSQNYIPLLIDSLYTWSWNVDMHGDTIVDESWSGFSYYPNDSLLQRRNPNFRLNYTYGVDSILLLSEILDTNDTWSMNTRISTALENGKITSRLTERIENSDWVNSSLYSYFYDSSQLDTMYLLQHWKNGEWGNFYKKVKFFDAHGRNIEEAEYYQNGNDFEYSRGKLFEYDNNDHKTVQIDINSSSNGAYFTRRTNWFYGGDDDLDSLSMCDYNYPNDGGCTNVMLATYDYLGQKTVVEKRYNWKNDDWNYYGKELTYKGDDIYSDKPDSVVYYSYWTDTETHTPTKRRYLQYSDLGNDSIYFKEEVYNYKELTNKWLFTSLIEEWYHVKAFVGVDDIIRYQEQILVFPNPAKPGQNLHLKEKIKGIANIKVLVFDMSGSLVSTSILNGQSSFQAPDHKGIYSILIREGGRLIGISKQVIID